MLWQTKYCSDSCSTAKIQKRKTELNEAQATFTHLSTSGVLVLSHWKVILFELRTLSEVAALFIEANIGVFGLECFRQSSPKESPEYSSSISVQQLLPLAVKEENCKLKKKKLWVFTVRNKTIVLCDFSCIRIGIRLHYNSVQKMATGNQVFSTSCKRYYKDHIEAQHFPIHIYHALQIWDNQEVIGNDFVVTKLINNLPYFPVHLIKAIITYTSAYLSLYLISMSGSKDPTPSPPQHLVTVSLQTQTNASELPNYQNNENPNFVE